MNLNLTLGRKYTICRFDCNGHPESKRFTLVYLGDKVFPLVLVTSDPKPFKYIIINQYEQFVIWPGTWKVNTSRVVTRSLEDAKGIGSMTVERAWPSYDPRYLERAKRSVTVKPSAEKIDEIKIPEILHVMQCIS